MPASAQARCPPEERPEGLPPVLVVDDDADDLFFVRRLLDQAGLRNPIVTFDDSERALAYLREIAEAADPKSVVKPCVMFLDIKMPKVHGFVLLKWVRQHPALDGMHVAMLSGSDEPSDRIRTEKLGADSYLVKFPPAAKFAEVVKAACRATASGGA